MLSAKKTLVEPVQLNTSIENIDEIKPLFISDDFFKKTYIHPEIESYLVNRFKIDLLGLESKSGKKFYIIPIAESILSSNIMLPSDAQQLDLKNCAFLSVLRSILRRYPQHIHSLISETNGKHVNIKLFLKNNDQIKQVNYQLGKTIITPHDPDSIFTNFNSFFKLISNRSGEKSWVKLLEKALVIHHIMTADYKLYYRLNSRRIHEKREDNLSSYEDIIRDIADKSACEALIGCKMVDNYLDLSNKAGQAEKLKENLINGEIIILTFKENDYGFEDEHAYELVNYGTDGKDEFVLVSNPWGYNTRKFFMDYHEPDMFSLTMLLNIDNIIEDKSIIAIPLHIFNKIAHTSTMTIGARELLTKTSGYVLSINNN